MIKLKQYPFKKSFKFFLLLLGLVSAVQLRAQTFDWAKAIGGRGADKGYSVTVDVNGNVYVTGSFASDSIDFNRGGSGGILTAVGNYDVFLAKYDAAGNFLWAKTMGGSRTDYGQGIAVDDSGNVYVTGYFTDSVNFNPGGSGGMLTAVVARDVFLAKYDTGGNYLWAKSMGGGGNDQSQGVAVDGSGNVFVTGWFNSDTANFNLGSSGGMLINVGPGLSDAFLAKYDAGGSFIWAKNMGGSNADQGQSVAVDGSGNVYVTGYFASDTADFNLGSSGGTLTTAGDDDVFLAKYDAGGNYIWARSMGGSNSDNGYGVAVDGSGNVYCTGNFRLDTADFNPGGSGGTLTTAGNYDIFLAKYDAGGNYIWARSMGGSSSDNGYGVAVDGSGNVYVTGFFQSDTANFNPAHSNGTLTTAGGVDIFLAKYDAGGNYLWAKNMGGNKGDYGQGIAVDGSGNVYGTGYFNAIATFDFASGVQLTSGGSTDIYLVKFGCSDTSSSYLAVSLPCGESYTLKKNVYTESGTYTQIFPNVSGCDSTITLDLTIIPLDKPVINVDSFVLGATGTYATYQWMKDGALIPGATDSNYTVTENGDYRVIVTNGKGCSDTSDAYPVTNYTGITDVHLLAKYIKIYPNPTTDRVYIQSPVKVNVVLTDIEGKMIRKCLNTKSISLKDLAEGIYLLHIADQNGVLLKVEKVANQK